MSLSLLKAELDAATQQLKTYQGEKVRSRNRSGRSRSQRSLSISFNICLHQEKKEHKPDSVYGVKKQKKTKRRKEHSRLQFQFAPVLERKKDRTEQSLKSLMQLDNMAR